MRLQKGKRTHLSRPSLRSHRYMEPTAPAWHSRGPGSARAGMLPAVILAASRTRKKAHQGAEGPGFLCSRGQTIRAAESRAGAAAAAVQVTYKDGRGLSLRSRRVRVPSPQAPRPAEPESPALLPRPLVHGVAAAQSRTPASPSTVSVAKPSPKPCPPRPLLLKLLQWPRGRAGAGRAGVGEAPVGVGPRPASLSARP